MYMGTLGLHAPTWSGRISGFGPMHIPHPLLIRVYNFSVWPWSLNPQGSRSTGFRINRQLWTDIEVPTSFRAFCDRYSSVSHTFFCGNIQALPRPYIHKMF